MPAYQQCNAHLLQARSVHGARTWQGLDRPLESSVLRARSIGPIGCIHVETNAEENKELSSSRQSTDHQDILELKTITTIFISQGWVLTLETREHICFKRKKEKKLLRAQHSGP